MKTKCLFIIALLVFFSGSSVFGASDPKFLAIGTAGAGGAYYPIGIALADIITNKLNIQTTAQITGGRYLFLTDDSGVGDTHKIPEIPCYYVTRLEKALVRVASMELSGTYIGPDTADILRISGDAMTNGTCSVGDDAGTTVQIF